MKKLLSIVVLAIIFVVVALQPSALATNIASGRGVFQSNCVACHIGGRNNVNKNKTLSKSDLEKYGMFDTDKIIYQVTNGKNIMHDLRVVSSLKKLKMLQLMLWLKLKVAGNNSCLTRKR